MGRAVDWVMDAVVLANPYALSFGTFFGIATSAWLAGGSIVADLSKAASKRSEAQSDLPSDMSATSLVGGGLIAGDALAALGLGLIGLLATVA
jgi:hypothetical protein